MKVTLKNDINALEKLYQKVKRHGKRRNNLRHMDFGHLSWRGEHKFKYYRLKIRQYTLNASEERYNGSSLIGQEEGTKRTLTIRTTHQILSAEHEVGKEDGVKIQSRGWQVRGSIPEVILKIYHLQS